MKKSLATLLSLASLNTFGGVQGETPRDVFLLDISKEDVKKLNLTYTIYVHSELSPKKVAKICTSTNNTIFPKFLENQGTGFYHLETNKPRLSSFMYTIWNGNTSMILDAKQINSSLSQISFQICSKLSEKTNQ